MPGNTDRILAGGYAGAVPKNREKAFGMNRTIQALLEGREDNHILPFFWQHGEDEKTLRHMMAVIHGANCGAVCIESRPHPDFCGDKWWQDMDVILDEARQRGMKVWILDDSHFPTGYANGALAHKPDSLCRQGIFLNTLDLPEAAGTYVLDLRAEGLMRAPEKKPANAMEERWFSRPPARVFGDDRILRAGYERNGSVQDMTGRLNGETLRIDKEAGPARLKLLVVSRNAGCHRDYINMTDRESVRVLLDAVYEPHWQHYARDFGSTIAGFFSDEPELGNGRLYEKGNLLGNDMDLPWGRELEKEMRERLGPDWTRQLEKLWEKGTDPETARVHALYMDVLTRLVQQNFSEQVGAWCRAHHVMYIGHVIEDDGQHCRTGTSLGHYFRGLSGQDMSGIDDIGGQVLPQGEDEPRVNVMRQTRNGCFYHYGLAKLAQSAAALETRKQGRAMCEIFGNYGWSEGVRLEKYLADHFLVRGINYFVPHAFTGRAFPDPDCPPHFYAQGHHPQYRHFGKLMQYMNRAAMLTSSGRHCVPAAVLYHGEAEWCDQQAMPFEEPLRALYDAQIDCHVVPADMLRDASAENGRFSINGQAWHVMVVPGSASLCEHAAEGLDKLANAGVPVWFVGRRPGFVSETGRALPEALNACPVIPLSSLAEMAKALAVPRPVITPENNRIRVLEIMGDTPLLMLVNEGTENWTGEITPSMQADMWYRYDAWENRCTPVDVREHAVCLTVEPLKSVFLVSGTCDALSGNCPEAGEEIPLSHWQRSTCEALEYPAFGESVAVHVPDGDRLAEEMPEFSGFVRYECSFTMDAASDLVLEIADAQEGVEVFLDGVSAGIQIAPPFVYKMRACEGEHLLRIEVATTLERACYPLLEGYRKVLSGVPACASGLTGRVRLCRC